MSGEVSGFVVWVAHYVATMCLNNLNLTGAVKIFRCAKVIGLWVCGSTIYFSLRKMTISLQDSRLSWFEEISFMLNLSMDLFMVKALGLHFFKYTCF